MAATAVFGQMGPPPTPAELAAAALQRTVVSGENWIVEKTTELKRLKVEPGAAIAAAPGHSLTMTVDGVQTTLQPGSYRGQIVLTVTAQRTLKFSPFLTHQFRQALLLDARGVVANQSVTAAAGPFQLKDGVLSGAHIRSKGANFNGLLVTGGRYTVKDLVLDFDGDGGNDFAGHGAGVMSDGKDTRLVLDGARINTRGVVRTAVVGHNGSHLIVRNSDILARAGTLAADYISNVTPGEMKDAPWMLGISGNNRATNVLGDDTVVTYIGSRIAAESWGVLSVDNSRRIHLTAINSQVEVTGQSGYGTYAIGDSTNAFYGSTVQAPSMGAIVTGGRAIFAASSAENLRQLDRMLKLELGEAGIAALKPAQTRVVSPRNGVMLWGEGGEVQVRDGTVFDTGEAVFLNKGATAKISIDGSGGAQLKAGNGVLLQQMDNDDPGPQMTDGLLANTGIWRDPTTPARPVPGHDLAAQHDTDSTISLTKIRLQGDIVNAMRELQVRPPFNPDKPEMAPPRIAGANLVVRLLDAELQGAITAATARHAKDPIGAADHESLGRVINTPAAAINNGVIVLLDRARWTVTGPSHLTRLLIGPGSTVSGVNGGALRMTVDGVARALQPGDHRGQIVLMPTER